MTTTQRPFTLRSAAGLSADPTPLSEATLVVIDVQAEYEQHGALPLPGQRDAIANIAALLSAARAQQRPVFHVVHRGSPGGLFDPKTGGRISELARPVTGEATIYKQLPNAFAGTDLHEQLQADNTAHLVLVGFMTHMCVSSTARAALDLGYTTTVIADATATRALPSPMHGEPLGAGAIHHAALATLADRFSHIAITSELLAAHRSDTLSVATR